MFEEKDMLDSNGERERESERGERERERGEREREVPSCEVER